MNARIAAAIPARLASTRLPRKLLLEIRGKSILQRVYERTKAATGLDKVVIVTDHEEIYNHALAFGAEAFISKMEHQSGTDRIAEWARENEGFTHVVNVQGDEPFMDPENINKLVKLLLRSECGIASLTLKRDDPEAINNPNAVKVVTRLDGRAMYFSRSPLPYLRAGNPIDQGQYWFQHIGLYGFERQRLLAVSELRTSPLERMESLEQLRWLQHGFDVAMEIVLSHIPGIDTLEDYQQALLQAELQNL